MRAGNHLAEKRFVNWMQTLVYATYRQISLATHSCVSFSLIISFNMLTLAHSDYTVSRVRFCCSESMSDGERLESLFGSARRVP